MRAGTKCMVWIENCRILPFRLEVLTAMSSMQWVWRISSSNWGLNYLYFVGCRIMILLTCQKVKSHIGRVNYEGVGLGEWIVMILHWVLSPALAS